MRMDLRNESLTPVDESLGSVVAGWSDAGYAGQFQARLDGLLHCLSCGASTPASVQQADEVTRLEGASDVADMEIIVPVTCPDCGVRGVLIANYGPEASAEEADVLRALRRDHPGNGTHGSRRLGS